MDNPSDIVPFRDYLNILRRGWFTVVLFIVFCLLVAFVVTDQKQPVYETHAELVIDRPRGTEMLSADASPFRAVDETFLQTQARILQSEIMVGKAVQAIRDAGQTDGVAGDGWNMGDEFRLPRPGERVFAYLDEKDPGDVVFGLLGNLSVGFVPKTRIFIIRTKSPHPEFAAAAANAIALAFAQYVAQTYASSAESVFARLNHQAEELSRNIRKMAKELVEFRHKSDTDLMTGDLSAPTASTNKTQELMERLAMGDPEIVVLENALLQVRQEIGTLETRYKPRHPDMIVLKGKETQLAGQIEGLTKRVYVNWQRRHLAERNAVEFSVRERELEAARKLHETIVGKIKELDFSKSTPDVYVRLLKQAEIPQAPSYPNKPFNLFLGGVAGCVLGMLVLFARSQAARGLVSLATPTSLLPAPLIARLPHVSDAKRLAALARGRDVSTPEAEAFKAFRTAVEALLKPGLNVVLITSPDRGDGKSTLSAALAHGFARLGRRVLLVDADLRRGRLHRLIDRTATPGLVERLNGAEDVAPVEIAENLFFVPRGTPTEHASELVVSARMESFVLEVSRSFSLVLLDCPPILPVTDASLLARYADAKLLVVRSGQTPVDGCRVASDLFAGLGYTFDGIVLNDIRATESHHYGRYHYYYPKAYQLADDAKG